MNTNYIKLGIALISSITLVSCGGGDKSAQQQQGPPPATPVSLSTVESKPVTTVDTYPGNVVALDEVELRAQVGGYITGIFVKDGQKVSKGQKLYEIDRTKYQAAYNSAKANVAVAKANRDKAKKDAERYTKLAEQDAVAKQRVDYALTDLANAESQVAAAEANLASANSDLQRSIIVSPLNGTIGISQVKLGAFASPGTTLLNTVSTNDPIAVDIAVNQAEIPRFRALQSASAVKDSLFNIQLQDGSIYTAQGHITAIDRAVDPQTGTIKVRISYPNSAGKLYVGMTVNMRVLNKATDDQLVIPFKAVVEQLGEYNVYVVGDSSKATPRMVKLGKQFDKEVVIREGLKQGEVIVVDGVQNVRPGAVVQDNTAAAANGQQPAAAAPAAKK
ncbi:efflux RND transporter periplasmic adaptor subunit [Pedobacter antarcticus]|uniref:Membrane fusion protein, multidrug efflux system n=1 Tax=Pedobacter antarcticus TaxID=34086 RepID=A0A1I2GJQ2_9SPHI|nr:efflux RND transporter periplasmic adaptor subunit [Pedobacter antarcticus]SDM32469.1 membrane fusion protein, multidrug efflux system [Pedobacter antarcticus]SFF17463.1 membrane fusion protein, multidrug efflux system [Pedobacter antarcticus]